MGGDKEKINQHRAKTWIDYNKWRSHPVYCPAFGSEVIATLKGWRHISGLGKKRTITDIHRRLNLIIPAQHVIAKSATIQNIVNLNGRIHYAVEAVVSSRNNSDWDLHKVRVIIEKQTNKKAVFLSVMDKKIPLKWDSFSFGVPHALVVKR